MPNGQFPTILAGQSITAALLQSMVPFAAYKTLLTGRTNTNTRTVDPDLALTVAANAVYDVRCYLSYWTGAVSGIGFRWGFVQPAGASGRWGAVYRISGDTATASNGGPASTPDFAWSDFAGTGGAWGSAATPGDGANHAVLITGTLVTGSSGSFSLSWAPDTVNASPLNLNVGSKLIAQRIG